MSCFDIGKHPEQFIMIHNSKEKKFFFHSIVAAAPKRKIPIEQVSVHRTSKDFPK